MQSKKTHPLWISHSSISDFLACPRAYYLRHVYRDPKTNNKITVINPALSLGQIVHQVLEALSVIKAEDRLKEPLIDQYNKAWLSVSGELGGFNNPEEELSYKNRGAIMINRVMFHPGPLSNKAIKLSSPDTLPPRFYLSKEEEIILCGKIDWLEYLPATDSLHIIDFKTGMKGEKEDSLQLPIYALLVKNCQNRAVSKISYWYLEKDNEPVEMPMPDLQKANDMLLTIGLQIKEARSKKVFACPRGGCFACKPLEQIIAGKAKRVGTSAYQDIYVLSPKDAIGEPQEDLMPF